MEINNKYSIGDKIFVLKDRKAKEIEVKTILFDGTTIRYSDSEGNYIFGAFREEECFPTMEELIAYITTDDGN